MSDTSQPTFEQLALIIEAKLHVPYGSIRPDTALKDIEADSLAILEVLLAAEAQFNAVMPTDEVSTDGTVEELYKLVVTAVLGSRT